MDNLIDNTMIELSYLITWAFYTKERVTKTNFHIMCHQNNTLNLFLTSRRAKCKGNRISASFSFSGLRNISPSAIKRFVFVYKNERWVEPKTKRLKNYYILVVLKMKAFTFSNKPIRRKSRGNQACRPI